MSKLQENKQVSVVIVETYSVVRWSLCNYLSRYNIRVVGETSDIGDSVRICEQLKPDIVLIDPDLDGERCLAATREIAMRGLGRVIAYSPSMAPNNVQTFLDAGGVGFVCRLSPIAELVVAMNAVMHNHIWVTSKPCNALSTGNMRNPLSPREHQVAMLIANGLSSTQVAKRLFISLKTVKTHRYNIFRKLGIHNRVQLIRYLARQGDPQIENAELAPEADYCPTVGVS